MNDCVKMLFVLLLAGGCSANATKPTEEAPVEPTPPAAEVAAEDTPAAKKPMEKPAAASSCATLDTESSFSQWREQLMARINTADLGGAKKVLQCAQPNFSTTLFEQSEEWLVDASPRHLDADEDEEWVLQFRQHSPVVGHGERDELVWLAIYDRKDGKYQVAGVIVRPRHPSCVLADDEGIKIEFGEDVPGEDAGMVLTEQDVKACGTLVDVKYTKTVHKLELGKLVSLPLKAPKAKTYNRTDGASDE